MSDGIESCGSPSANGPGDDGCPAKAVSSAASTRALPLDCGVHFGHGGGANGMSSAFADLAYDARREAAGTVEKLVAGHLFGPQDEERPCEERVDRASCSDPVANAALVKDAALSFGADLVGICRMNRAWLYSRGRRRKAAGADLGEEYTSVVVMAVAMDADAIAGSPGPSASAATRMGYMRMSICSAGLGVFVRKLGWRAFAAGNGTALSVPLAIGAGLGELGRNGLLLTPQYGPCVRISKVFTDMPLRPDEPSQWGIAAACRICDLCAVACPGNAIDARPEPTVRGPCGPEGEGISRWPVDGRKCSAFWRVNKGSCANCVAVCPYVRQGAGGPATGG